MAQAERISVGTTATLLGTGTGNGMDVAVKVPTGGSTVYVGSNSNVAAAGATQGFPLAAGESVSLYLGAEETLYGIVAASTQNVHVLRARES